MKIHDNNHRRRFSAARLLLCMILAVGMIAWPATPAQAAGIITHAEIVNRAANNYLDQAAYPELAALLSNFRGVVQYGSMFPDWGMAVDKLKVNLPGGDATNYVDLSEDAHDTLAVMNWNRDSSAGFRSALAGYLLPAFRRSPQTEADKKAIAFLFGLIAHQETDGLWHINDRNMRGFGTQLGGPLDPVIELYADLYVQRTYLTLTYPYNAINGSFLPNKEIISAYGKKALPGNSVSTENKMSDNMLSIGRANQQRQVDVEVAASYSHPCLGIPAGLLIPNLYLALFVGISGTVDCATYLYTTSVLETYPTGGLQDDARKTARVWQQTWNWLNTYTPYTQVSLSSLPPNGIEAEKYGYSQPVSVTLSGTDMVNGQINPRLDDIALIDTGPFRTFYSINDQAFALYTQPLNFVSDGIYNISYYSVDKMGNQGSVENLTINIKPTTQIGMSSLALSPCLDYHVVKNGEKTSTIAHTYQMKWKEIAKANRLGIEDYPGAGDLLCIPNPKFAAARPVVGFYVTGDGKVYVMR